MLKLKNSLLETPFKETSDFGDLFKQYFNPLVNFIYSRYIKDYELAKDIVQSTFSKIWEKKDDIVVSSSVKSYLFQAAKNRSLDYIRANSQKTLELQDNFREYEIADEQMDHDDNSFIIREEIVSSLKNMKPKMREIFELNKFKGFSYDEIAEDMSISKRAVEDNMARAFKILREELTKNNIYSLINVILLLLYVIVSSRYK